LGERNRKNGTILSRIFVIFKRSAPLELKYTHLWNCRILEDVFGGAQGNYLETEDSSNIAMFQGSLYGCRTWNGR